MDQSSAKVSNAKFPLCCRIEYNIQDVLSRVGVEVCFVLRLFGYTAHNGNCVQRGVGHNRIVVVEENMRCVFNFRTDRQTVKGPDPIRNMAMTFRFIRHAVRKVDVIELEFKNTRTEIEQVHFMAGCDNFQR